MLWEGLSVVSWDSSDIVFTVRGNLELLWENGSFNSSCKCGLYGLEIWWEIQWNSTFIASYCAFMLGPVNVVFTASTGFTFPNKSEV